MSDFIVPMRDKPKVFSGNIPWTRIEDIEGKYLNGSLSQQYVSTETIKIMNLKVIPKGSLIVSSSATFGVVAVVTRDLITNQTFIGLVPKEKETVDYWYSFFQSTQARTYMRMESAGSTIFYITREKFENMPVTAPGKLEMLEIGSFFSRLDQIITLHQRKLEGMKLLKKSLLQKMFPKSGESVPEVRFPGFTDAWEQRKLGEISEKVTTKNQDMVVNEVFTNSAEYGIISQQDFFDKDIANSNKVDGYYLVEPDDFVYNPRISNSAPFGPIKRNKLGRSGAMSPLYYVFRSHDVDKSYLDWFFQTNRWHAFMRFHGNTGVRSDRFAITDKIFAEMTISIPQDIDEQKAIGTFFTALDDSITLHQRKVEILHKLKKSLLQQMFV